MEHLLHPIILWLHLHPTWSGVVTCLITFFESLAIIGIFIPGSVTLTAIGGLVGSGVIPATQIFIWAIIGAIVGDGVSYWLGYRFHKTIRGVWPLTRFPGLLSKGETFFAKHGGKSIFIGRFVGPVRPIMPLVAGMLRVNPVKFFTVDIISGILWAPVYMIPGILVGAASAHFAPDQAIHFIIALLIIIVILLIVVWLSRHFARLLMKTWIYWMNFFWPKLRHRLPITYHFLCEHEHPQRSRPLSLFIFALGFLVLFIIVFIIVCIQPHWLQSLNLSVLNFFESLVTPSLTQAAIIISDYLGKDYVLLGTVCLILLYLCAKRDWHASLIFISLLIVSLASVVIFKHLSQSTRPNVVNVVPSGFSFPSGHTLFAFVIFSYIAFLVGHIATRIWIKRVVYWSAGIIVCLVFLSRLILNVHWLSDIIGSLLLGGGIICLIVIAYRRKERYNRFAILPLILLTLIGQLTFGTIYYIKTHQADSENFRFHHVSNYINPTTWWQSQHPILPIYRHNRLNKPVQILNIQWFASLSNIERNLTKHGWQVAPRFGLTAIKQQLMGKTLVLSPFTPQFEHHKPVLVMTKKLAQKDSYLILRLWDGGYRTPIESIYVGNLSYHLPVEHWLWNHKAICPGPKRNILQAITKVIPNLNWRLLEFKPQYKIKTDGCTTPINTILLIKANSY